MKSKKGWLRGKLMVIYNSLSIEILEKIAEKLHKTRNSIKMIEEFLLKNDDRKNQKRIL